MSGLLETEDLDELLKEIDGTKTPEAVPEAAAAATTSEPAKPVKTMGISSTSFSTYGKVRSGTADIQPDDVQTYDEKEESPTATSAPKRVLPRSLEPLGRVGYSSDKPTPWDATLLQALPGLKKTPQTSPSKASNTPTKTAQTETITAKTDITIRCIRVCKQSSVAPMPRWGHCLGYTPTGNSILVFGGMRENGTNWEPSNDMHEFNIDTQSWEPSFYAKGQPPSPRYCAAAVVISDSFYIIGGMSPGGALLSDIHEYNSETQEWITHEKSPKFTPRGEHTATLYNKKIIIFGGRILKEVKSKKDKEEVRKRVAYENDLWLYDTKGKKMRHITPGDQNTPGKRSGHSACIIGSMLYIHGGSNMQEDFCDLWKINVAETHSCWQQILVPVSPIPRVGHIMVPIESHLFLFGGTRQSSGTELIQFLDTANPDPHWVSCNHSGALASAFVSFMGTGCVRNGVLYSFGGRILPGNSASSDVLSMLLCTDILIDNYNVSASMLRSFKKLQSQPPQPWNTVKLTVGGSGRVFHNALISDMCPKLWEQIVSLIDGSCCSLDGNKRRKGVQSIPSSDVLHQLGVFMYSGRFDESYLTEMQTIAVELQFEALGDYISSTYASRVSVGAGLRSHQSLSSSPKRSSRSATDTIAADTLFAAKMHTLRIQGTTPDVRLKNDVSGSTVYNCHSFVLASASPVLRKIFRTAGKGKPSHPSGISTSIVSGTRNIDILEITVSDLSSFAIETALTFMYEGTCNVTLTNAAGVMQSASFFKLPLLTAACEKEIWTQMSGESPEQICSLLVTAERYTAHQLREKCMVTLATLPPDHINSLPSFSHLTEHVQKELLLQSHESRFSVTNRSQQSNLAYQQRHDAPHSRGFL